MHTCVLLTGTAYVRMFMFVLPSSLSVARLNTVVKYSVVKYSVVKNSVVKYSGAVIVELRHAEHCSKV
jgi:hypothetical protein